MSERDSRPNSCSVQETVQADPLGIQPLFARRGAARPSSSRCAVAVSARLPDLVEPNEPLDMLGLSVLLTLGFPLGDRTAFQGIRRVNPSELVRSSDGATVTPALPANVARTAPTPLRLKELFINALERGRTAAAPIVPLSGGRDSRLIYLGLRSLGIRPRVVLTSGGLSASADARIAARLTAKLGDPIEGVAVPGFARQRELWRHRMQNFESLEHGWFVGVALRARSLGGPVTDGIGLGVLSTGSLMKVEAVALWKQGRLDELAEWTVEHAAGIGAEALRELRASGIALAPDDAVKHEIVHELRSLAHLPNPLGAFSLFHWTRRGISASAFGLLEGSQTVAPLADPLLASELLAIELDAACASDWRDVLLKEFDSTGIPFADDSPVAASRRRLPPMSVTRLFGARAWMSFQRRLDPELLGFAQHVAQLRGTRRVFGRAALGMLTAIAGVRQQSV